MAIKSKARHDLTLRSIKREIAAGRDGEYVALSGVQQNNPDDSVIVKISAIRYLIVHNKE